MNYFKSLFKKNNNNYITLFTGGHLNFTRDIILNISKFNKNLKFLVVLNENENINSKIEYPENVQIFKCDIGKEEDVEELTSYLTNNEEIKINNVIHSDHYISSLDHSINPVFSELKYMTEINIENSMILNSKLLATNKLKVESKIIHLVLPSTSNIKNIPGFHPKRLLGNSLKHMVNCSKQTLEKNPVFFSLVSIETYDKSFINRFENNISIPKEENQIYGLNYDKSIDLISCLLSDKLDPLEFGKKFWSLNDLNLLKPN